ncbi:MAG: PQQ-binding-like beta-propeller repeat protein [Planctomycetales bacterium]|nr:PQQ-binding-like beta-propeller repeat protein [bacterium]UNM08723.1 MAG: PQQ-binding-like beta-propeller repeat protein [Planctomycetales bacterium]
MISLGLLLVLTLLMVASCGSNRSSNPINEPLPADGPTAHLLLSEYSPPAGMDPDTAELLLRELQRVLDEQGITHYVSAAPGGVAGAVSDLSVAGTTFKWSLRNNGDYDQNGEVNVADITPVGIHLGKSSSDADWGKARLADGDGNGQVTIADITPIGINFGNSISGYVMQYAIDQANFSELQEISFASGVTPAGGGLKEFTLDIPQAPSGYYMVQPFSGSGAARDLGADSNVVNLVAIEPDPSPGQFNGPGGGGSAGSRINIAAPDSPQAVFHGSMLSQFGQFGMGSDGRLYSTSSNGFVNCVGRDGEIHWSTAVDGKNSSPGGLLHEPSFTLLSDNSMVLHTTGRQLYRISSNGEVLWQRAVDAELADFEATMADDVIMLDFSSGELVLIDESGNEEWRIGGGESSVVSSATAGNGNIYFLKTTLSGGVYDMDLVAVDSTGIEQWSRRIVDGISSMVTGSLVNGKDDVPIVLSMPEDHLTFPWLLIAFHSDGSDYWTYLTNVIHKDDFPPQMFYDFPNTKLTIAGDGNIWFGTAGDQGDVVVGFSEDGSLHQRFGSPGDVHVPVLVADNGRVWWSSAFEGIKSTIPDVVGSNWLNSDVVMSTRGATDENNNLYTQGLDRLQRVDEAGEIIWDIGRTANFRNPPAFAVDSSFYTATNDVVLACDRFGNVSWSKDWPGYVPKGSPLILDNGDIVYMLEQNPFNTEHSLVCYDPAGELVWKYNFNSRLTGAPSRDAAGNLYVLRNGAADCVLTSISPAGDFRWDFTLSDVVNGSSAVQETTGPARIHAVTQFGIRFIIAADGSLVDMFDAGSGLVRNGVSCDGSGNTFFTDIDGVAYRISPDGLDNWSYDTGTTSSSSVRISLDSAGNAYFAPFGGSLTALDTAGNLLWSEDLGSGGYSTVLIDNQDRLFLINDQTVYAYSAAGSKLWEYTGFGFSYANGLALNDLGQLYAGDTSSAFLLFGP